MFELSNKEVYDTRAVYSFWDFLGDVGGLADMMRLIGYWILAGISLISGSRLN